MARDMAAGARPSPSFSLERSLWASGYIHVAGVDEVGRGPLAGPVYSGAVVLDPTKRPRWLREVRDSKILTPAERERLDEIIRREAVAYGIGWSSVGEIDAWGITNANRVAMMRALWDLPVKLGYVLIDGPSTLPQQPKPQKAIVRGDATCSSIAAASIVAKVARDRLMKELDSSYPNYGFASNKGYATKDHVDSLERFGPCEQHRRSWLAVSKHSRSPGFEGIEDLVAS